MPLSSTPFLRKTALALAFAFSTPSFRRPMPRLKPT